jgi:hypothetical protein
MMTLLKGLIFDNLSFIEVLITSFLSTDIEAPALNRSSTTSLWPWIAAL